MIIEATWMKNMADKLCILFDINVLMDVLQRREPFYETSARLKVDVWS